MAAGHHWPSIRSVIFSPLNRYLLSPQDLAGIEVLPELARLTRADRSVLQVGLGSSRNVRGVRHVTPDLEKLWHEEDYDDDCTCAGAWRRR